MVPVGTEDSPFEDGTRTDRAAVKRGVSLPTWVYQGIAAVLAIVIVGLGIWATQLRSTVRQQQATITQLENEVTQQNELLAVLEARDYADGQPAPPRR